MKEAYMLLLSAVRTFLLLRRHSVKKLQCKHMSECLSDGSAGCYWIVSSMWPQQWSACHQTDCTHVDMRIISDILCSKQSSIQSELRCRPTMLNWEELESLTMTHRLKVGQKLKYFLLVFKIPISIIAFTIYYISEQLRTNPGLYGKRCLVKVPWVQKL